MRCVAGSTTSPDPGRRRIDTRRGNSEHPATEVAAWLDEIAAVHRGPLEVAINGETRVGATPSVERQAALKFGPVAANGLRAAWSRHPERDTYAFVVLEDEVPAPRRVAQQARE